MSTRPIKVPILGVDQFTKEFSKVAANMKSIGKGFSDVGRKLTTGITLPVIGAGIAALKVSGDFEASMKKVKVLTGATGEQFSALSQQARDLGATTQFSASQAADAMGTLAMAGWKTDEILAGMPGTLQLAAAAETDLATAADIATGIMAPFRLAAKDLTMVTDVMAETFSSTPTYMLQLAEGMKYVAPVAGTMGLSINETTAALGQLAFASIKGEQAGTALRNILADLVIPSREAKQHLAGLGIRKEDVLDSKGNVKSIVEVLKVFEKSGAGAGDVLKIFGMRGGPAMAALLTKGSKSLEDLIEKTKRSGLAADIAKTKTEGLYGELKNLRSAAEELGIALGESGLLRDATELVKTLTFLVRDLGKTNPEMLKFATYGFMAAAALGPLFIVIGQISTGLGALVKGIGFIAPFIGGLAGGAKILALNFGIWGRILVTGIMPYLAILGKLGGAALGAILTPVTAVAAALAIWVYNLIEIIRNWDAISSAFSSFEMFGKTINYFFAGIAESIAEMVKGIPIIGNALSGIFKDMAGRFDKSALEVGAYYNPSSAAAAGATAAGANRSWSMVNNAEVVVRVQSDRPGVTARKVSGANTTVEADFNYGAQPWARGWSFAGGSP